MACAVTSVLVLIVVSSHGISRYRWRTLRLHLLTGTHRQRTLLRRVLAPVLREFLPLLDRAVQEVRGIVLLPTLSGADGKPFAAEIEQLGVADAFVIRLAHRMGSTVCHPEEVAGALAEDLLFLYRHAAAVTVVRQTDAAVAAQQTATPKLSNRNGLAEPAEQAPAASAA